MKSEIYLMTILLQYPFSNDDTFQNYLKRELIQNTPNDITVSSIDYYEDKYVSHFIHEVLKNEPINSLCRVVLRKGGEVSKGFFKIVFDADQNIEGTTLPWLESFINSIHSEYEYLMSYFFYKYEKGIRHFGYFHNHNCDEEMESFPSIESYNRYIDLFESYFKTGEIPTELYPFVAKLMLINRINHGS